MSFKIEILKETKNPLIERLEIQFRIDHFGKGTPNRLELKNKIAAMKNANENLTIIRNIKTNYGASYAIANAYIYENAKVLQYFEPFHIEVRNLDKEKRSEIYKLKKRKESYKHLFEYK